jgi:hypothetical protein
MKESHFYDTDEIRSNMTVALKVIPQHQFQNLLKRGLGAGIGA